MQQTPSMMNSRFRLGYVWTLCFVLIFLNGTSAQRTQPDDKEIDRLAKAYRAAHTEFERRAVCIEAIDAGVIAVGRPVAVVDAIFGTTYAKRLPPPRDLEMGVVDFHPLPPPPRNDVQAGHIGWYFGFSYDSAGRLKDYSLSNVPPK
jgi:hypothetical protein